MRTYFQYNRCDRTRSLARDSRRGPSDPRQHRPSCAERNLELSRSLGRRSVSSILEHAPPRCLRSMINLSRSVSRRTYCYDILLLYWIGHRQILRYRCEYSRHRRSRGMPDCHRRIHRVAGTLLVAGTLVVAGIPAAHSVAGYTTARSSADATVPPPASSVESCCERLSVRGRLCLGFKANDECVSSRGCAIGKLVGLRM